MLRKFVLVGVIAGASASVPILHQNNPQVLEDLVTGGSNIVAEQPPVDAARLTVPSAREAASAQVLSGRRVRLAADERGHFFADFRLNGRSMAAMVDTGASRVAINRSTARRIGISLIPSDFTVDVSTANGRTRGAFATIDRLEVGRVELRDVEAVVLEDTALSETLIGMSFLSRLRRFHVESGALVLEQ